MDRRHARIVHVLRQRLGWVRVAAEHLHHRHNVSALMRTIDAVGIHDVHVIGDGPFHPARGPTKGADHWLRVHHHAQPTEAITALREQGYAIWVADFADPPVPPEAVPVDRPLCLWFGAELAGVSPEVREVADGVVTVPMHGFAQSLNISVAAALTLYSVCTRVREELGDRALLDQADHEGILTAWMAREHVELSQMEARHRALEALGADLSDADVYPPASS